MGRRLLIVLAVAAAVFVLAAVVTWPSMFVSQKEELTGLSFDLRLINHIDDGSRREGKSAWILEIPEPAAAELAANPDRLRDYQRNRRCCSMVSGDFTGRHCKSCRGNKTARY